MEIGYSWYFLNLFRIKRRTTFLCYKNVLLYYPVYPTHWTRLSVIGAVFGSKQHLECLWPSWVLLDTWPGKENFISHLLKYMDTKFFAYLCFIGLRLTCRSQRKFFIALCQQDPILKFIFVFSELQLTNICIRETLPMLGFEPRISDVGSANWATTKCVDF